MTEEEVGVQNPDHDTEGNQANDNEDKNLNFDIAAESDDDIVNEEHVDVIVDADDNDVVVFDDQVKGWQTAPHLSPRSDRTGYMVENLP